MSDEEQPWWHETPEDETRYREGVGTATQEAVKLAAAVSEWATKTGLSETLKGFAEQTTDGMKMAAGLAAHASKSAADSAAHRLNRHDGDPEAYDPNADYVDAEILESAFAESDREGFSTCDVCPVCQGMSILREVSPDAAASMADALSAITEIVKQTVETMAPPPSKRTHVEHIDIE